MVVTAATNFPSFDSSVTACWDSFDSLAAEEVHFAADVKVVEVVAGVVEVVGENFDLKKFF